MVRLVILRVSESYFRHRWLYMAPIALMIVVGALSSLRARPVFISRGAIYVQKETLLTSLTSIQDSGFTWVTPAQTAVDEFGELIQTDAFIRAIIKQTDLEAMMSQGSSVVESTIADVRKDIWVQALGQNLMLLAAADETPQLAEQKARALGEAYIQWKINADRDESMSAQVFFSNLVQSYRADLEKAQQDQQTYLEQHPDPVRGDRPTTEQVQIQRLQAAVDVATTRLSGAMDKEDSAKLALAQSESKARQTYLVIDAPSLPRKPENSKKDLLVKVAILAAVGLILSATGVIGAALLDDSFRFPIDVQHSLNLPVLAIVPDAMPRRNKARKTREPKA